MGLLKYIVSLPSHQRASIIASMLANIPTITCCCDDVLPTEPHIESQSQYLSTIVSACGAYATLSACVDCITQAACITLVNIIVICSALVAYSAAACLALLILLLPLVPLVPLASFVCVTPRRCCRCGARASCAACAACAACSPHTSRVPATACVTCSACDAVTLAAPRGNRACLAPAAPNVRIAFAAGFVLVLPPLRCRCLHHIAVRLSRPPLEWRVRACVYGSAHACAHK